MTEKYLRRILDNIKSAVVVVDENLKAVYANRAFGVLFPKGDLNGNIGAVTACTGDIALCGVDGGCKRCGLASAFEDAFLSQKEVARRIFQRVKVDDSVREISYSITVTPIGGGFCMGAIDNAIELEIARELQSAKNIQQRLLPAGKWAGGKKYSYMYIPCREIGGDLPDVYTQDGTPFGVVADVSGKGISAGMLSAFVKAAYDKDAPSPALALKNLNSKFTQLNLDERNYVTVAAVRIDPEHITYSMAGHNVPILLKTDSGVTRIMLNSPPISNWFENPSYFDDTIPYKKGDILVLLTDGVTECKNGQGEMFGVEGAIKTLSYSKTADDFIKNLENNLNSFCDNLNDDITAIAFDL
ncbi:MAG: SpoIIE family protein phosphatase [Clostridiales bacterium]|nr:SpoIIE family protein phosphatase [Clostridiales bacterium]